MKFSKIIAGLFMLASIPACVTMENPDPTQFNEPTVTITNATATASTITMTAKLSNGAASTYGFKYGYNEYMGNSQSVSAKEDQTFTLTIPVEQWDSRFYCQAYVENSYGKRVLSETKTLTTPATPAGGVTLSPDSATLKEGETIVITATVTPEAAQNKGVSWRSDNEEVATVTSTGEVTAVKAGNTQIIAKTDDGGYEAVCSITVKAPVTGITLDKSSAMLQEGGNLSLKATVLPENASSPNLAWNSSNEQVITVADGNVTAVGSGIATITASVSDEYGSFSAICQVYVYKAVADLGLSVKWSGFNIGATSALNSGNRYAWAEVESKDSYSWDNYIYGNGSSVSKYCLSGTFGTVDYISVLTATDDVATTRMGSGWHTPSVKEWTELKEKCKWELVTIDGIQGYMVSGASDWIFLPLCGRKAGSDSDEEGIAGYYWTSTLDTITSLKAQSVKIDGSSQSFMATTRCTGFSIRPVQGAAPVIPVLAVAMDKENATIFIGDELNLVATVYPVNASNIDVNWSSSNPAVATVEGNGKVTAKDTGTAIITVTTADGGKSAICKITVVPHVNEVKLNRSSLQLSAGESETLTATVLPEEAPDHTVTWSSSDTAVATVDENGKVTAIAKGTAIITATSVDGNMQATCTVTVNARLESVSLDVTDLTIKEGDVKEIVATIKPEDASISGVSWTSSKPEVASVTYSLDGNVSKAKINGEMAGSAVITVTVTDISGDSKTASCTVKVNPGEVLPTYIKFNKNSVSITEGDSKIIADLGLSVEVGPVNATDKSVSWSSAAPSIFTVDGDGVITAISVGKADLIGTTVNGLKATCTVSVIKQ